MLMILASVGVPLRELLYTASLTTHWRVKRVKNSRFCGSWNPYDQAATWAVEMLRCYPNIGPIEWLDDLVAANIPKLVSDGLRYLFPHAARKPPGVVQISEAVGSPASTGATQTGTLRPVASYLRIAAMISARTAAGSVGQAATNSATSGSMGPQSLETAPDSAALATNSA
jgi:hypothetical protein